MDASQDAIDLLCSEEGFQSKPYNDVAGNATIGYGTLLHKGPVDQDDLAKYLGGITISEARALLRAHVEQTVVPVLNSAIHVPLKQCQFDALVSFVYNIGAGAFKSSTLLQRLNLLAYDEVPEQMNKWTYAGGKQVWGLVQRRTREIRLWERGDDTAEKAEATPA